MSKKEKLNLLLQTLGLLQTFNQDGYTIEDCLYLSDERMMNTSIGLILEIRELLDKGYSEEEIITMIENINFDQESNFDEEEKQYLKQDAIKSLKRILKNKGEDIYE